MLLIIHQDTKKNSKKNNFRAEEIYVAIYAKYRRLMEVESFSENLSEFIEFIFNKKVITFNININVNFFNHQHLCVYYISFETINY